MSPFFWDVPRNAGHATGWNRSDAFAARGSHERCHIGCCPWGGRTIIGRDTGLFIIFRLIVWLASAHADRILYFRFCADFWLTQCDACHLVRLPRREEDERCLQAKIPCHNMSQWIRNQDCLRDDIWCSEHRLNRLIGLLSMMFNLSIYDSSRVTRFSPGAGGSKRLTRLASRWTPTSFAASAPVPSMWTWLQNGEKQWDLGDIWWRSMHQPYPCIHNIHNICAIYSEVKRGNEVELADLARSTSRWG